MGHLHLDGALKVQFAQSQNKIPQCVEIECMLSDKEFCMQDCMLHESACAVRDGSKKYNCFRGHCMMTDCNRFQSVQ